MKKYILILVSLFITSLAWAEATTADIEKHLPGKWQTSQEIYGQKLESSTAYSSDGTVTYDLRITSPESTYSYTGEGHWKVEGDKVVVTITKSSSPDFIKVGEVMKDTVTFIDSHQFSYVDDEGTAMTEHRD